MDTLLARTEGEETNGTKATLVQASASKPVRPQIAMREAMLTGPVLPVMARLALPTIAVMFVQTLVSVAETYFVSSLGTQVLAGVALAFPVIMLMTTMSNGGVGSGVASSIARALGAGRKADADALVLHTLVLAAIFGAVFSVAAVTGGPWLYRSLGGSGDALHAALVYSNIVFAAAVPIWIVNLASAALRGAGHVKVPAMIIFVGALILMPLSPALIFGWGPFPRFGVAGAGVAMVIYYLGALVVMIAYLLSGRGGVRLTLVKLEWRLFRDILRVGAISALATVQSNLTVVLVTGAVGRFGTDALAGYGMASRLDYLLIPIMFGLGSAVLTMVGTNVGAGEAARARRIAWVGSWTAFVFIGAVGLVAAIAPRLWLGLFSHDEAALKTGTLYLHTVGPFYGLIALGFILYFAAQGAGRAVAPFVAGSVRLLTAAGLGWLVVAKFGAGMNVLFGMVALAAVLFAAITSATTLSRSWGERHDRH